MNQLKMRLGVAAWGIPLIVVVIFLGDWIFALFLTVVCFLGQREFYHLAGQKEPLNYIALFLGGMTSLVLHFYPAIFLWFLIAGMLVLILALPFYNLSEIHKRFSIACAGVIYPSVMLSLFVLVRDADWGVNLNGALVLLLIITSVWICDTAAYFAGKAFGRRKLAPAVSPHKTWEGAVFGLVGALLWAVITSRFLAGILTRGECLGGALIVGVIGQLGDLAESALKRAAGVKDSSSFLGPHGGILDRFDSLIAVAPAFFLYFKILGKI